VLVTDSQPNNVVSLSLDVSRWTLYRTPVGSLENAVLCCALFTKPYHSNDGAVVLRVCVAMGLLLHSNEHLQISTVAERLSMFTTCGRIPWEVPTILLETFDFYFLSNIISTIKGNIKLYQCLSY
jgi:hypothetical protein